MGVKLGVVGTREHARCFTRLFPSTRNNAHFNYMPSNFWPAKQIVFLVSTFYRLFTSFLHRFLQYKGALYGEAKLLT